MIHKKISKIHKLFNTWFTESFVGVSIMWPAETSHDLPTLSRVGQHIKLSDVSLGTRPQYSLVVDKNVKKPTNQTNKLRVLNGQWSDKYE